jgi:hypothetical protein
MQDHETYPPTPDRYPVPVTHRRRLPPYQRSPASGKNTDDPSQNIFQHRNIAWAHTDNKYKFFISAFRQMKNFLR